MLSDQGMKLTRKQKAVLKIAVREHNEHAYPSEGMVTDELWPLVRSPRRVLNALVDKGLVQFVEWWDEEIGYLFALTDAGRAHVNASGKEQG